MKNDKFEFTYSAPTERERREIESIKKQYVTTEKEGKLENLRNLNQRVNRPPKIVGAVFGIAGILIFGLGLTMALEWSLFVWGAIVGVAGAAITAATYPIYQMILKKNKQKYGRQIIDLSNDLLNEGK